MKSRATTSGFLVICFVFCGAAWGQQEPAGEGRPITPAGALVIDASTHLPAVGAMPMAMLRSPDARSHLTRAAEIARNGERCKSVNF